MRHIQFRGKVNGEWWEVTPDMDCWTEFWFLVDKDTVGEYVGIRDELNKAIYEGDIVKYSRVDAIGIVTWVVTYPGFAIINLRESGMFVIHNQWEVIGNTWDDEHLFRCIP